LNTQTIVTTRSRHLVRGAAAADFRSVRKDPAVLATLGFAAFLCVSVRSVRKDPAVLATLGFAAFLCVSVPALAATAPSLGTATSFAVLGASAVSNTGPSVVSGDLGIFPGTASSVTGFPPGQVIGATHFADADALGAQNDVTTAYNNLAGQPCTATISADLAGSTLNPGVYCSATSMGLSGALTLDAQGDPNAVFIFKVGTALTTGSGSSVRMINGGQSCNVFWQIGSSATLGTTTTFVGNILALTSITMLTGATDQGRLLARTGAVTLDSNNAVSVCSGGGAITPIGTPTLNKAFSQATINPGGVSTLTITMTNPNAASATLTAALVDTLPLGVVIAATPNVSTTCGGVGVPVAVAGASTVTLPAGRSIPGNGSCTLTVNVTAAAGGSYINPLPAGSLATTNGSNAAPAAATLTVAQSGNGTPLLGKAFSPATFTAGGVSTLTVTLSNPNGTVATLTAPLVDTLPSGMVIAATPNVGTTCGGVGAPVAVAGGSTVTLPAGRTIPANGSCTLTVDVTTALGGSYSNILLAGALVTTNGSNAGPAVVTSTVAPPAAPSAGIPTLSEWVMALLAALLAIAGVAAMRRRAR
jgi:uncharacterized repeat protein (TIGR01451 family)